MNGTFFIFLIGGIVILGLMATLAALFFQKNRSSASNIEAQRAAQADARLDLLTQNIRDLVQQVNDRLRESVQSSQFQSSEMRKSVEHINSTVSSVTGRLSQLEESSRRIFEMGKDLASLQEILRAPKLRGGLGEQMLADILSQIVPKNNFELQYGFASGEKVDAVVRLNNFLLPIDSKFPLENFKKYIQTKDEAQKALAEKSLATDVKKHIDAIAKKYILTDEGTTDFALMYIPAENVYYELFVRDEADRDLIAYSFSKKVIPISPNSFYAYLQAILLGLRGQQIEKRAKEIWSYIGRLEAEMEKFGEEFDKVGTHLTHAQNSYVGAEKRFDRLEGHVRKIGSDSHEEAENLPAGSGQES